MEAYAKRLEEQRAADAAEAEEEDRKRKARPFLKDTAYDRRKVRDVDAVDAEVHASFVGHLWPIIARCINSWMLSSLCRPYLNA